MQNNILYKQNQMLQLTASMWHMHFGFHHRNRVSIEMTIKYTGLCTSNKTLST